MDWVWGLGVTGWGLEFNVWSLRTQGVFTACGSTSRVPMHGPVQCVGRNLRIAEDLQDGSL